MAYYKPLPPAAYLRECFSYDPLTGVLTWKHRPLSHFVSPTYAARWNARYAGTRAGCPGTKGYLVLDVNKRQLKAARVIWRLVTGVDPAPLQPDHIDHDPVNNAWCNLRLADDPGQQQNRTSGGGCCGFKGVSWHRKKFRGTVTANGVIHYSKLLPTPEQAAEFYCRTARDLHGAFYCPPSYELEAADVADVDELYPC